MNPEVVLRIEALDNTKQALASVRETISGVQESTKSFTKRVEELQPTFKTMAITGGAAFTAVAAKIGLSVNEAQKAEAAQFRLSHILRTATGATDAQIKALNDQAAALERVGVVSGESITQAQAQLATFDLKSETIQKLTPAILDYVVAEKGAAASTEDLKQLTNGLAQALNGNFGSLTRVGFVLDDVTKEMISNGTEAERAAALVQVLNSTYEGMNVAARNTAQGGMVAVRNEISRLAETIGNTFLPMVQSATTALIPVINRITDWVNANPGLTRSILIATAAISGIIAAIGAVGLAILPVIAGLKAVAFAFALIVSPISLSVAAIGGVIAIIYRLRTQIVSFATDWQAYWNGSASTIQNTVRIILLPLAALIEGIGAAKRALSDFFGWTKTAGTGAKSLQDTINGLVDPMAGQSRQVTNFGDAIKQVSSDAKQATDNIARLKKEAQDIFGTVAKDEVEANRRMAETIVEQEASITDKKRELRKLERAKDSEANESRIEELRFTIQRETEALQAFKGLRQQLSAEIEEAERRASLTAFERKMEDMLRERAARLQAQVDRLLEIQKEVEAEKQKSNSIASAFEAGQSRMQEAIRSTSTIAVQEANRMSRAFASVFDNLPSFGSQAIRNLTAPVTPVRRVNDAVITPKGDIISTHPDDWLIATKTPGTLAGADGPNITINISGTFLDDRTAAQRLSGEIMSALKHQMRV